MKLDPVQSSSVHSIGYDGAKQELHVKYHGSGKTYSYAQVPYTVHFRLMNSVSKGKYLAKNIHPNYKATEL